MICWRLVGPSALGLVGLLAGCGSAPAEPGLSFKAAPAATLSSEAVIEVGSGTGSSVDVESIGGLGGQAVASGAVSNGDESINRSTADDAADDAAGSVGLVEQSGATLVGHAVGSEVAAYASPDSTVVVSRFGNPTDHGGPLVFQAITPPEALDRGSDWIEVLLPVRPNGTTGWVRTADLDLSINPYRIEVDVDDFTLTVFRHNAPYLTTPVGIGRGETPTPDGSFYLAELLRPSDPGGTYGPYAYGLSGFSEVLDSFAGGEGVIGIHGTDEPWAIGTNVSHGCIRVDNSVIEALATFLPLGTPVDIGT